MALQLAKPSGLGVDATYWRIGVLNIHPRSGLIYVVLDGYLSQAARTAGAAPVSESELQLPLTNALADGGRQAIYDAVKGLPEYGAATDV
jgi:hypothetical protein